MATEKGRTCLREILGPPTVNCLVKNGCVRVCHHATNAFQMSLNGRVTEWNGMSDRMEWNGKEHCSHCSPCFSLPLILAPMHRTLHRHRPQIAFPKKLGDKWKAMKGEAGEGGHRNQSGRQMTGYEGRQIMKGDQAAAAPNSRPEWRSCREINEGRQGGSSSQEQDRMEIMQGDKWRATRRQPRAAQNGDYEGRQMKGNKAAAAAKSSPEWKSWREANKGRWRETRRQRHDLLIGNPVVEK